MQKINNTDLVRIREVYTITQRLEDKIDKLDTRISNIEGKSSILAIVWSSCISIIGISIGVILKR